MHAVFLSMGGVRDTDLAGKVKDSLPDGLVYMYTRNGEEGTAFRREIEAEVNACRLFVVFWSDDYLSSEHAKIELATFKRSAESVDSGRELLVVQANRKGPNIQRRWKSPLTGKEEYTLGRWRFDRAVSEDRDHAGIAELIGRKLESTGFSSTILAPRPDVQKSIAAALDAGGHLKKEFVFISGSEGDGRRTAVKTYMESSKHLLPKLVSFDNVEGPQDVLERLLEYSGETITDQIEIINQVNTGHLNPIKELRKIIHGFRTSRNYLILIMDRYSGVDPSVGIPTWVSKLVEPFKAGRAPLIFFITSNPVTDELLRYFPHAGRARVNGLDEFKMGELVFNLSTVDPDPNRWNLESRNLVSKISGSSPSLCQSIMRLAASESDLRHLERISRTEEEKFSASLSGLVAYIVEKFKDSAPDLIAMRVVEKLGVVAKSTLDEIMIMKDLGNYDLYSLLQYGVFEQLSDNLIRIPPLLQRRLGFVLWDHKGASELDEILQDFGKRDFEVDDGHGIVYLANKAGASLRSPGETLGKIEPFITLSMLFKAGVERYGDEDYETAHSILKRAMSRLERSADFVDETICIEIARYFGLASARVRNDSNVDDAVAFLSQRFLGTKKEKQAEAMAAFLNGFRLRVVGNHRDALQEFEKAHYILKDIAYAARQDGAALTEISRANLRLSPPRLDAAVRAAQAAYQRQDAIHNLNSFIRAKIYKFSHFTSDNVLLTEIQLLLSNLKTVSERTGSDFHLIRNADLSTVLALDMAYRNHQPLDLSASIKYVELALSIKRSDLNQFYLWKLKSLNRLIDYTSSVISEAGIVYTSANAITEIRRTSAVKALIMSHAKHDTRRAMQLLTSCRELSNWQKDFFRSWIEKKMKLSPDLMLWLDRI